MTNMRQFAEGDLRLETGRVAKLILARPSVRNALTHAMWDTIAEVMGIVKHDASTRVLILMGEGQKAFSSGADIAEFADTYATPETAAIYNRSVRNGQASVADLPIPVIAEIRGACFGGGFGLALHCDIRFAAKSARFGIPPAKLGLAYSFEDTKRLVELAGPSRAKDILMSGRTLSAEEAYSIGLVDRVVDDDNLESAVEEYSDNLAALSYESIRVSKETIAEVCSGHKIASESLRSAFEATFSGEDFTEGYQAFIEKRKPNFS